MKEGESTIYKVTDQHGKTVMQTSSEIVMAAFLLGILSTRDSIINYNVTKNGAVVLKTLTIDKYKYLVSG